MTNFSQKTELKYPAPPLCETSLLWNTESYLNTEHSNHIQQEYLKKIYSESDISLCSANCAIMKFATSNNLTYSAINDLLTLLKFLCPKPNIIPSTIYKLKKFFNDHTIPYTSETYCTKCHQKECQCEQPQSANISNLVSIDIDKSIPRQYQLTGSSSRERVAKLQLPICIMWVHLNLFEYVHVQLYYSRNLFHFSLMNIKMNQAILAVIVELLYTGIQQNYELSTVQDWICIRLKNWNTTNQPMASTPLA